MDNSLGGSAESYIVTITPSSSLSTGAIVVTLTPAGPIHVTTDLAGNTGTATRSTTAVTVSFADKIPPTITVEIDNAGKHLPRSRGACLDFGLRK